MRSAGARTVIGIALAGLIALGAGACAPAPQWLLPIPPDIRAQISRVGILGPPPPQFTYVEPLDPGAFGDALRDDVVALLARDAPQYAVELLAPTASDGPPLETSADTVVALENLTVDLRRCDVAEHVAPPLTLYAAVDAQLLQGAPRPVLHRARFEYWGESATFGAWGAADAEQLAQGLASARRSLAEQIVQSFFVAQAPTALRWPRCGNQAWRYKARE
jgi:hypothetical protein